jgi:hypothetical protein
MEKLIYFFENENKFKKLFTITVPIDGRVGFLHELPNSN